MKTFCLMLLLICSSGAFAAEATPPPETPTPPPSAPAKRSAVELEKLVAPIALYPDPLIATLLPASVYPLEIVQAARFVADTNNLAKLDEQPWDNNVKAVARVPEVIKKLNEDLSWTMELGEAFLAQDKDVMDAIQSMRGKAQKAGTLQTSPQQVVTVTNVVVEKTVEQQVVVVTNTVVQIQPSNPQVVYVPTYNPTTVYYPPPAYVYDPLAPLVTFGAGMAMGAIIANNCDWHHGGCYSGNVNINNDINVNRSANVNNARYASVNASGTRASSASAQKWQPDQSRLSKSGAPSAATSAGSKQARGYGSASSGASPQVSAANRAAGNAAARPSTGNAAARPSTVAYSGNRPTASPSTSRSSPSPSASQSRLPSSSNRGSASTSAFSGARSSGASAQASSSRGASSRGGGGGGGRGGGRR